MPVYRFYLLDAANRIFGAREASCVDRDEIERTARDLLIASGPHIDAVEAWDRATRLCRIGRAQLSG